MKKIITLALALLMVFAIAVPAMAFTTDTTTSVASDWDLDAALIEYSINPADFFNALQISTEAKPANRGYAKNEIVAVCATVLIPEDCDLEDVYGDGTNAAYTLHIYGEGVTFRVADLPIPSTNITGNILAGGTLNMVYNNVNPTVGADELNMNTAVTTGFLATNATTKDTTVKFIVFAKVTADEGYITVALEDAANSQGLSKTQSINVTAGGYDWIIAMNKAATGAGQYTITPNVSGTALVGADYGGLNGFYVNTDRTFLGTTIVLTAGTDFYRVAFDTFGNLMFVVTADATGAATTANPVISSANPGAAGITYRLLSAFYNEIVKTGFGLDATLSGYVRPAYFEAMQSASTLTATVEIEPYTAYVTVPDNIVTEPPKTGAAIAISGFVMMAASLAAVAMKKK